MRDRARIKPFLQELEKYWDRVPDWRFGQFMCNFLNSLHIDPFFIEDDDLLKLLRDYFKDDTAEIAEKLYNEMSKRREK